MRKQLLFVTYKEKDFSEGLPYAIDLAKAMHEDLVILFAQKNSFMKRFEQIMSAITFAEADEHETARREFSDDPSSNYEEKLSAILEQCQNDGLTVSVYTVSLDALHAIRDFLKQRNTVDMVLLSPSVTDNGNIRSQDLQKLVRTASRPVVTMARHVYA